MEVWDWYLEVQNQDVDTLVQVADMEPWEQFRVLDSFDIQEASDHKSLVEINSIEKFAKKYFGLSGKSFALCKNSDLYEVYIQNDLVTSVHSPKHELAKFQACFNALKTENLKLLQDWLLKHKQTVEKLLK